MIIEIICTARNDNYYKDNLSRLQVALNYNLREIKENKLNNNIYITLVDWFSIKSLSSHIKFYDNYKNIKFINFPKKNIPVEASIFNSSKALNLGIRNSQADYILICTADQILSGFCWKRLYEICVNEEINRNRLMMIERKYIPVDLLTKKHSEEYIRYVIENNKFCSTQITNNGGASGAIGASKVFWHKLKGFNEFFAGYGGNDGEIFLSSLKYGIPLNGSIKYGIYINKFPYDSIGGRNNSIINYSLKNPWNTLSKRSDKWGMKNASKIIKYPHYENKKSKHKTNLFNLLKRPSSRKSNLKFIFTLVPYLTKKDNIFFLFKIKKMIEINDCNNYILDGNFTISEYLTFSFTNRASNIFITNQSNFRLINNFIHHSNVSLKFLERKKLFEGNIFPILNDYNFDIPSDFYNIIKSEDILKFSILDKSLRVQKCTFTKINLPIKNYLKYKKKLSLLTVFISLVISKIMSYFLKHIRTNL